jgi:L-2,4-diaminobutyrate decarboxylase
MSKATMFAEEFLIPKSPAAYRESIAKTVEALQDAFPIHPYSGKSPAELAALLDGDVLPQLGSPIDEVLGKVRTIIAHSVAVTHPNTIAHLHCPPLIASLAAEVIIAALNQSMDSFDQAPAATMLELAVARWLCEEAGLPPGSDAVFTGGGTQSNFMALLLARDACIASHWNWNVQREGLPPHASRLRFLCSEVAHFTVEKSAYPLPS